MKNRAGYRTITHRNFNFEAVINRATYRNWAREQMEEEANEKKRKLTLCVPYLNYNYIDRLWEWKLEYESSWDSHHFLFLNK